VLQGAQEDSRILLGVEQHALEETLLAQLDTVLVLDAQGRAVGQKQAIARKQRDVLLLQASVKDGPAIEAQVAETYIPD